MKKELLFSITKKDFEISFFSGKGAGGQHRNKHQNCCRMVHPESGATATGQSNKERISNIREAFRNIINSKKFKLWMNKKIFESLSQKSIEEIVEDKMKDNNLLIEMKKDGKWVEYKED